jgi:hypothetical protein
MPSPVSARLRAPSLALLATVLSVGLSADASARVTKPQRERATAKERVARLATSAKRACARADRVRTASARRQCRDARAKLRRARRAVRAVSSAQSRRAAPVLTVSGQTISWKRVADVNRYKLATTVPGQPTAYRVVTGLKVTPPAVPGKTVNYGLRTDVDGSAWAREVSISYPASTPAPAPTPTPGPSPAPTGFEAGIVSGSDVVNEARYVKSLAPKVARVEFDIWQPAADLRAAIAAHAANGTRVLLLAGFHATMPTAEQARNLAGWAREFGPGGSFWAGRSDGHLAVREIEFGNETSYGYQYGDNWDRPSYSARAREYALRFRDAQQAIQAANPHVGLLAQADDANTGSANWVNGMFDAVPDLASRVAGWTIHPYGTRSKWEPQFSRLFSQTAARGASSSIPIYVTEWGLASDNGRCLSDNYGWDKCMTYAAAASALHGSVADMRALYGARLRAFFVYQGHDQRATGVTSEREHYFGALRSDLGDKGAYSAEVRSLLRS